MDVRFEKAFLMAVKKHAGIKKQIEQKVRQLIEHPVELGEPLKGNFRGFYSCPVKKSFIIYLYCGICRKKGDDVDVTCADCAETGDETIKFVIVGPHDAAYSSMAISLA
jgi:mRNA-degrading endonuclease YafQ of YafQ-DinJ toxin-antitoxin module